MAVRNVIYALMLTCSVGVAAGEQQHSDGAANDPLEGINRGIFKFNDTLDTYALKPIAQGYRYVAPDVVETGVSNFFGNLSDVGTLLNNMLQGKFADAGTDFARVVFNSTIGLGGIIDVATPMGLEKHDEDFGQTLGAWGVPSGPYVVLPLFGPSNVRDGLSSIVDTAVDPVNSIEGPATKNAFAIARVINNRALLLDKESIVTGDRYSFIRDAYMQSREFSVYDGEPKKFDDSNF